MPGHKDYEAASKTLMTKGAPAVVVRVANAKDVAAAIAFARANDLLLSVRSGGHSGVGHSTNKGGMVIDVTRLNEVKVIDEAQHLVRIGSGALWGDVAKKLEEHGLVLSSGDTRSVGVGGIALAAGVGWMVRKYGLTIDHMRAAEIVTADGRILRVSETENPDLFWAVRGGGGNFGVATYFEFVTHPCGKVYAGNITYSFDKLRDVLKGWRDGMRTAPEELTTMLVVMPSSPAFGNMPPMVILMCCYAGNDKTAAMSALDPFLKLDGMQSQDVTEKDYAEVLEDAHPPDDMHIVVRDAFFEDFSDEMIDTMVAQEGQLYQIRSVGGAMNRVPSDATAFAHRSSEILIVSPVFLAADASDADVQKALVPWNALAKFGKGAYVNFFTEDTPDLVHQGYPPDTFKRLSQIKKQYDPENVFNQNFNIPPAD